MAIRRTHRPSHDQTVYLIQQPDLTTQAGLRAALQELEEALDQLVAERADASYRMFSFEVVEGAPGGRDRDLDEQHDPWSESVASFWVAVAKRPALHEALEAWVCRVASILAEDHVWETEEVQLGEPVVSVLALLDRRWVPLYTSLLRVWDMDHEVEQLQVIDQLVQQHGLCPEMEELLFCRVVTNPGQWGIDQLEQLYERQPEVVSTPLFERIVRALGEQSSDRPILAYAPAALQDAARAILER